MSSIEIPSVIHPHDCGCAACNPCSPAKPPQEEVKNKWVSRDDGFEHRSTFHGHAIEFTISPHPENCKCASCEFTRNPPSIKDCQLWITDNNGKHHLIHKPTVVQFTEPLPERVSMKYVGSEADKRHPECEKDTEDCHAMVFQQLRLNESPRALLLDIGINVNEIGEGRPIVLKFT